MRRAVITTGWNRRAEREIERAVERLLLESPWRPEHVWHLDGVEVSERAFCKACERFERTGERPDWWTR